MTSLTQLIQESIPEVKPGVKYVLRTGEINGLMMVLAMNCDVIPDSEEVVDTLARFHKLAPAEKLGVAKRIAEIAKASKYQVGYHVIAGPLINIWVRNKETKELVLDVIESDSTGRVIAKSGNAIIMADINNLPPRTCDVCKESDL